MKRLLELYRNSLILLVTHSLCIIIGATWAYVALIGVLNAKGVL